MNYQFVVPNERENKLKILLDFLITLAIIKVVNRKGIFCCRKIEAGSRSEKIISFLLADRTLPFLMGIIMAKWAEKEKEWLVRNYPSKGWRYCAEKLGRSIPSIRSMTSKLELRLDTESEFFKDFQRRAAQSETIKQMWKNGQFPVFTKERRAGVSIRTKKWLAENPHPKGYQGHKHSPEICKKLSKASLRWWASMTPEKLVIRTEKARATMFRNKTYRIKVEGENPYSRTKSGKRKDLDNQFFRSATEANYARFLRFIKIDYTYEKKTFEFKMIKRGTMIYTPDFYLPSDNIYIEVKGWLDPKSITKLKRFKKYYPDEFGKLRIVKQSLTRKDKAKLLDIGFELNQIKDFREISKLKKLIPNWEY